MKPVVVVHGGAGRVPEEDEEERWEGCRRGAPAGWGRLLQGGAALRGGAGAGGVPVWAGQRRAVALWRGAHASAAAQGRGGDHRQPRDGRRGGGGWGRG